MAVVSTILPLAAVAALVTWTLSYGRRVRARSLAAGAVTAATVASSLPVEPEAAS